MEERAGLILLIPFLAVYFKRMAYIYVTIFLVFTVTCFFTPAKSAIIPNLVKKGNLVAVKFPIENIFYSTGVGLLVYAGGFLLLRFSKGWL